MTAEPPAVVVVDTVPAPMPPPALVGRAATPAGLPYPTPQDPVCQTDRYIRELADAVDLALASSSVAVYIGNLTTNAQGDVVLSFPGFASVSGGVAHCVQNNTSAPVPLVAQVWLYNGQLTVRWHYIPTNAYVPQPWVGTLVGAVICWGVPK